MAYADLILKFDPTHDNTNEVFYLTDATALYDVTSNPGGYGTPNPDRNTLALFVIFTNIYNQAVPVNMPENSYDEEAVTKFGLPLPKTLDYIIQATVLAVAEETGGEGIGDYYYNTGSDEIRQKTAPGYDVKTVADLKGVAAVIQTEYHYYLAPFLQDTLRNRVQKDLYFYRSNADKSDDELIDKLEKQKNDLQEFYEGGEGNLFGKKYDRVSVVIDGTKIYIDSKITAA